MENYDYISNLLNELVFEPFFIKKEDFKQKNLELKDFINENVKNEKFPDIKSYKSIYGTEKSDICGFYALFYTLNYIKYILKERDIYYIYKNTNKKSFYKFYKNFLSFFISNMPSLEQYEIEELNKESSLERHHLDFILKNNLLFKYIEKKYKTLLDNYINNKKYKFEFEWFDFVSNNFAISEIDKIQKLNKIFHEISDCTKCAIPQNKIFFLYVGLTEHWILVIYDSFFPNILIEIDSNKDTREIINLKYLDQNEIKAFLNKTNDEILQYRKKPLNEYQIKQYNNFVNDTQRILYKLNNFILKNNKGFSLDLSILEERCNSFLEDFNSLNINKNDKLNELLIIYNWFANNHPKRIKEDFYDIMKQIGINRKNCDNEKIKKFFELIKELNDFLNENIKLIEQEDIKNILEKGFNVIKEINSI